jgi:hypothetical protein
MADTQQKPTSVLERAAWPIAAVLIVAILTAAGLYLAVRLSEVPREALQRAQEVIREIKDVASAFRAGTINVSFASYATSLTGSNYLQFATLRQTEVFTLSDHATIFWGTVELPDVIVSATAPVEYTAYLDLDERWEFQIDRDKITVIAPEIRFNKPSIDASEIRYQVRQDSLLRDEEAVLDALKTGLTEMSILRARDHLPEVRKMGRQKTADFVTNWLGEAFSDGHDFEVEVHFADELPISPSATTGDKAD